MPLYDFKCESGHTFDRMVRLTDFEAPQDCACGAPASRVISAPMFTVDSTDYTCPITGEWIGSKVAHRENLAKHGCRVLETGETEAVARRRAVAEAQFDKSIEDTVEREFESLPSAKKEQLSNELLNGKLDVSVDRL